MTGKDIIQYIQEHHYEECELLAKVDDETNKISLVFKPQEKTKTEL